MTKTTNLTTALANRKILAALMGLLLTLTLLSLTAVAPAQAAGEREYSISVRTGGDSGASTGGEVWLTIFGANGTTEPHELETSDHNDFQNNETDRYTISDIDVGEIKYINMQLKNDEDNWQCDWVEIDGIRFNLNGFWFDQKDGPRTFQPGDQGTVEIKAYTADVDNAGTDHDVYIRLYCAGGLEMQYYLDTGGTHDDMLRDAVDTYTFAAPAFTDVEKVGLWLNNSDDNWCVGYIEVNGTHFEARGLWVGKSEEILYPLEGREYEITTDTADEFEGGTSGDCYVKFIGDSGETRWMIMDHADEVDQRRGESDTYYLRDIDVGTVRQIVLQTDSSDEWCIARVHFQGVTYHCHGKGIEDGESFTIYVDYSGNTNMDAASAFSEISTGTWFAIIGGGVVFVGGIIFAVVRRKKQSA